MRKWLHHKHITLLAFIVLVSLCFPAAAQEPIRIGATVSLEGEYAKLSFMVRSGYEVWVKDVNSKGGLLGRPVELITHNDKSSKDLVGELYEKLIVDDGVDLLLSPYGSTLTLEAAAVADKYGYVMLAATASALEIWEQGFKNIFGVYSTADRYFLGFLDLVGRQRMKDVAIFYRDAAFPISAAQGSKKWAELFGLNVSMFEIFSDHGSDLPLLVKRLKEYPIENVIFCGYPDESYLFLKLLQQNNIKPRALALTIVPVLNEFYTRVGPFAEDVFGPSQWEADKRLPFPGATEFIESFENLAGVPPPYQACSSYSSCQILEKAITHAGTIDQQEISRYISSLNTITIMGRFKVDSKGRQIGHNPILIQWQDGKKEIVYPASMSTAPARFRRMDKE